MKLRFLVPLLLVVATGCTVKWGNKEISAFQMQLRDGSASVYSTKLYGANIEVPIPGGSSINISPAKFQLGYIAETKGVIPTKNDGELPNVLIDLSTTHGQNTSDLSDTYATGDVTKDLYNQEDAITELQDNL